MEAPPARVPRIVSAKRHPLKTGRIEIEFDGPVSPQDVKDLVRDLTELRRRNPK